MSNRRRNLFILAFVALLIDRLRHRHRDQEDDPRPRPAGRDRADLPGAADAAEPDDRRFGHRPGDRDHPRADRRLRRLRAGDLEDRLRLDPGRPPRREQRRARERARSGRPPSSTSTTGSRTSSRTRRRRTCRAASRRSAASTTLSSSPPSSSRTASRTSARPAGPQYYLFNSQTHAWIAGPTDTQKRPVRPAARPEAAAQLRDPRGAAGHRRRGEGGGGRRPRPPTTRTIRAQSGS